MEKEKVEKIKEGRIKIDPVFTLFKELLEIELNSAHEQGDKEMFKVSIAQLNNTRNLYIRGKINHKDLISAITLLGRDTEELIEQPNPLKKFLEASVSFIKKRNVKKEKKLEEEEGEAAEPELKSFIVSQIPRSGKNNALTKKDIEGAIEELDPTYDIPRGTTKDKLLSKYVELSIRENKETMSNTLKNTGRPEIPGKPNLNSTFKKEGKGMKRMRGLERLDLLQAENVSGNTAAYDEFKKIISRLVKTNKITKKEKHKFMESFRNT